MKRGTITILIILVVALGAALVSLVYHYRNQHRALEFWGTTTALLIDKGPQAELLQLGEPGELLVLDDDAPAGDDESDAADVPPPAQAVEFNQIPWMVTDSKDAAGARGIANLRRALVLDTTFDWSDTPAVEEPVWQYAISVNDGRNWATVLFDFDSRQVGLTGGRKTVLLDPDANADFRQFFGEQFPADAPEPGHKPAVDDAAEPDAGAADDPDQTNEP